MTAWALFCHDFDLSKGINILSEKCPVVLDHYNAVPDGYSAKVVEDIFKKGGNAVDAAVATAFTLAVTYPEAGNIGGGGFMTVYMNGKPYFIDYREVAPKAATKDMYLDDKGEVIENMSVVGAKAAGVPGTVLGLWEAHKKFGKLKWAEVVQPAIGYAENGFVVADTQSRAIVISGV